MSLNEQIEKKNILDFQIFRLRKNSKPHENVCIHSESSNLSSQKETKASKEFEFEERIKNIKESVQRINKLISELRHISDNPNK